MHVDFLIVGQGLAGSLLGYQLLQKKQLIHIVDDPDIPAATSVAAGIFNPVTGKRMVLTWNAHQIFPYLNQFYPKLQQKLGNKFFHPMPIYKPFKTPIEMNDWMGRSTQENYSPFIEKINTGNRYSTYLHDNHGGICLRQGGFVRLDILKSQLQNFFIDHGVYDPQKFDHGLLNLSNNHIHYQGITAKKIVFCEGPGVIGNKFFSWLPFQPVKGEILEAKLEQELNFIVSRDIFIVPLGEKKCWVGATYDQQNLDLKTTEEGKSLLINKLKKVIEINYSITGQRAGIRPASQDRRPLIGLHPEYLQLAIFNGFGTKGVSLMPYYAEQFANFMLAKQELDREVNISRYYKNYLGK